MHILACPAIQGSIEKFRDPYPLDRVIAPWRTASTGDCVGLLMTSACDDGPVGRPSDVSYLLKRPDGEVQISGLVDLTGPHRGDLASIAVQLFESHPLWQNIERVCTNMPEVENVHTLLTPHAALVYPRDVEDYEIWAQTHLRGSADTPAQEDIASVVSLILPQHRARSSHWRIQALETISDMLAWHDRRIFRALPDDLKFGLNDTIAADWLQGD
jgi:hypothetical protein